MTELLINKWFRFGAYIAIFGFMFHILYPDTDTTDLILLANTSAILWELITQKYERGTK